MWASFTMMCHSHEFVSAELVNVTEPECFHMNQSHRDWIHCKTRTGSRTRTGSKTRTGVRPRPWPKISHSQIWSWQDEGLMLHSSFVQILCRYQSIFCEFDRKCTHLTLSLYSFMASSWLHRDFTVTLSWLDEWVMFAPQRIQSSSCSSAGLWSLWRQN